MRFSPSSRRWSSRVLDEVAGRLAQARSDVGQQCTSTVAQRVATTLLRLAYKLGQERSTDGCSLNVPPPDSDFHLGVQTTQNLV